MASSYSTDLKLELMVTGENAGTWGDKTNTNLNLVQQAIAGFESIALSDGGTVALAMSDAALSNARNMVLKFTGTLTTASTVTIPDGIEKFYIIDLSAVTGVTNLTIKTVSGTGFTAGEAAIVAAYSDGTNLNEIALNTLGGTIATAQIDDAAISTAKLSNNAVTTAKISNLNVTEAKLAASAVTADKIAQSTITQAKLATNSVGPDQLISTGVTAAEYTVATITVDADGRVTAASSGTAGANLMEPTLMTQTPGTHTATPATTKIYAYMNGGGGGGGGGGRTGTGGRGGFGGHGFFSSPIAGGTATPFTIGTGGNGGAGGFNSASSGNPGNATTFGNLFTANGGSGGGGGGNASNNNRAASGTAPGGLLTLGPTVYFGLDLDNTKNPPNPTQAYGDGGQGGNAPGNPGSGPTGQAGFTGAIAIFEDTL